MSCVEVISQDEVILMVNEKNKNISILYPVAKSHKKGHIFSINVWLVATMLGITPLNWYGKKMCREGKK